MLATHDSAHPADVGDLTFDAWLLVFEQCNLLTETLQSFPMGSNLSATSAGAGSFGLVSKQVYRCDGSFPGLSHIIAQLGANANNYIVGVFPL